MRGWQVLGGALLAGCTSSVVATEAPPAPSPPRDPWHMPPSGAVPTLPAPAEPTATAVPPAWASTQQRHEPPPRFVRPRRARSLTWDGCLPELGGPTGPSVPHSALRRLAERFKRCYESSLKADPNAHGRVDIEVHLTPSGRVERVRATTDNPALEFMLPCLKAQTERFRFPPPGECGSSFTLPILFVPGDQNASRDVPNTSHDSLVRTRARAPARARSKSPSRSTSTSTAALNTRS